MVETHVHVPVLLSRTLELLAPALSQPGVVVDGTLGLGGHSEAILATFPDVTLVGIDRDPTALELATQRLAPFADRFVPFHGTYDQVAEAAAGHGPLRGVLLDLGVSSMQLDDLSRGFSYAHDAPLDMRMDTTEGPSAADLLNDATEAELREILYRYGEEKFAPRIARSIVACRQTKPLSTTAELVDIVRASIPAAARRTGGNPAKRTFQAFRVAVNRELEILADTIPAAMDALEVGGRIVVMAYQSLEDRIVKQSITARTRSTAPPGMPVELPEQRPTFTSLTRGAEKASADEITTNPRAASVRLRAAEKIRSNS